MIDEDMDGLDNDTLRAIAALVRFHGGHVELTSDALHDVQGTLAVTRTLDGGLVLQIKET